MSDPVDGRPADADEGVGCRPLAEAGLVGWGLFVLGVVALFGSDPATVGVARRFVFFLGAPATTILQFLSPSGFPLAWPVDLLVWTLAAVWVARAGDRRGWWRRLGVVVGVAALVAGAAV